MEVTRPHRVSHTFTQRLVAPAAEVFPLLCPVREVEWVDGWNPRLVISSSGIAEEDCVFVTGAPESEAVWMVIDYQPPRRIEFIKVVPAETVTRISIQLRSEAEETHAEVTYTLTALSRRGSGIVDAFTAEHYHAFMVEWEGGLNHFLVTGRKRMRHESEHG